MLTPLDIENKKFQKQIKGYNVEEVDDFLDDLTVDYEKIYKEKATLNEENAKLKKDLEHYRTVEHTLQNTLVMAQTTAEDIKKIAKQQADQIIKDAQAEVKTSLEELNRKELDKKKELEDLKKQIDIYKANMEALLISQLELLKDINEE